jgi:Protein of unknown function (DUF3551)
MVLKVRTAQRSMPHGDTAPIVGGQWMGGELPVTIAAWCRTFARADIMLMAIGPDSRRRIVPANPAPCDIDEPSGERRPNVPSAGDVSSTRVLNVLQRARCCASAWPLGRGRHVQAFVPRTTTGDASMRLLILSLVFANALTEAADPAWAQSPVSYPWCSRGGRTSANNCYYASKEQCMKTISGIGAFCFENPYYRKLSPARDKAANSRRPRHP